MAYKSTIQQHNAALEEILATVNELPDASNGVEINVIAATTLPSTVVNNQIVVITDTTPGTIYVDTDEPTSPVEGDVWVVVGASENGVGFSGTFRNGFMSAKQYISSNWEPLDGYIGISGSWVQFSLELPVKGTALAEWTWRQIKALANSGSDVTEYFAVGDEKELVLTTGEVVTVAIGDFNHNIIVGTDRTAAFAFTFKTTLATGYAMNTGSTNAGGWDSSLMRSTYMPTILSTFPTELLANDGLKTVEVVATKGSGSSTLVTSEDKLRLHSIQELGLSQTGYSTSEGSTYSYYSAGNRAKVNTNGTAGYYYTRSPYISNTTHFGAITPQGGIETSYATPARPIALAFDI